MIKVTIWNEFAHEKTNDAVKEIYPDGMHITIADFLKSDEISVKTVTLDDENCGITEELLNDTDVLIWWGHIKHEDVPDEIAALVRNAVLKGMGFIPLHSAHHSKPFKFLMGTSCDLSWRENGDYERIWVCNPSHPIAQGIDRYIYLPNEETYSEPFAIPEPDELVFIGSYENGEVFRSGCCYKRGYGKIFYFQPGHEAFPTFKNDKIQTVIRNAVYWAKPVCRINELGCPHIKIVSD